MKSRSSTHIRLLLVTGLVSCAFLPLSGQITAIDMFNDYGDKKYKPNPLLWKLYRTNQLGVRTGKGFYLYEEDKPVGVNKTIF